MCVKGLNAGTGMFLDGTFRFHLGEEDLGGICALGTFSQYAVVSEWACVPLQDEIPGNRVPGRLRRHDRLGLGGTRGRDAGRRHRGGRGAGGVGSNAVQGARWPGRRVVVVDPVEFKRETALDVFGATHAFATAKEAHEFVVETTWGQLADHVILTPRVVPRTWSRRGADDRQGRQGTITAVGHSTTRGAVQPACCSATSGRSGARYSATAIRCTTSRGFGLYRPGDLKLDELITRSTGSTRSTRPTRTWNEGKNLRGVIVHEHGRPKGATPP